MISAAWQRSFMHRVGRSATAFSVYGTPHWQVSRAFFRLMTAIAAFDQTDTLAEAQAR
jgi:hypothetical protein